MTAPTQLALFPPDRVVRVVLPKQCLRGVEAIAFAERDGRVTAWCNPYQAAGCATRCDDPAAPDPS